MIYTQVEGGSVLWCLSNQAARWWYCTRWPGQGPREVEEGVRCDEAESAQVDR